MLVSLEVLTDVASEVLVLELYLLGFTETLAEGFFTVFAVRRDSYHAATGSDHFAVLTAVPLWKTMLPSTLSIPLMG